MKMQISINGKLLTVFELYMITDEKITIHDLLSHIVSLSYNCCKLVKLVLILNALLRSLL